MREIELARERFEHDTRDHEMTVLREDGLYRHLRFKRPNDPFYYYDLVTWPGYLAIVGDCGDYIFSRERDMFEWFKGDGDRISPDYWASKLQAPRGTNGVMRYSHDAFVAHLHSWARDEANMDMGLGEEHPLMYPSLLIGALDREILCDYTHHPEQARDQLSFLENVIGYDMETWEWDLREFDPVFLWCCWAIVRGISQYQRTPVQL